ncbi:ABC transporter substrate-binding protein [Isoptericola sp. NPDC056605]|uniref:ABC transporter substrate-binding protein n=1 Tax=Isoptericola sp. NPDC056605 TaxID=3345876 RepID=UPI0036C96882
MRGAPRTSAVAAVAAVAALALAACGSNGGEPESGGSGSGGADEVEVFTWWAAGSEKAGLDALVKVFDEQHPDVTFINGAVAGGAGSQAKDLLQTRLQAQDPPDTFQAHAGAELQDYIDAAQIEPVSDLYDEFGLTDAFPPDLVDRLKADDGEIYSIPSNIHRANVVWTNRQVLTDAGLDPDATYPDLSSWMDDLAKLKDAGVTPLAIAQAWTQVQLLETVLLSDLGAEGYSGLWDGSTDWSGPEVKAALEDFETLMGYTNTDRDGLDWPESQQLVIDGKAGFTVMGDWAEASYVEQKQELGTDYSAYAVPGTDGVFDFLADSFTLPVGAPHPGGAKAWLETVGSAEGQEAFNKAKGSIPARTDIDMSTFGEYQQSAAEAFKSDTIVSSLAHGAAVPVAISTAITDATSKFTSGASDLATFQSELAAAVAG